MTKICDFYENGLQRRTGDEVLDLPAKFGRLKTGFSEKVIERR